MDGTPSPNPGTGGGTASSSTSALRRHHTGGFASLARQRASPRQQAQAQAQQQAQLSRSGGPADDLSVGTSTSDHGGGDNDHGRAALEALTSSASIRFVDPSTPLPNASPTKSSASSVSPTKSSHGDHLYEQLIAVLRRDYGATLRSVPYRNLRTGAAESIDALPVRPYLAGGGGDSDGAGDGGSSIDTTTTTSSDSAGSSSDPAEWHRGPLCHVYVAACRDVEHYRSKVRPALRAFVGRAV